MIDPNNDYTKMQRDWYNINVAEMETQSHNHRDHDSNPLYWHYLIPQGNNSEKIGFDFGCGHGRNIRNLLNKGGFGRVDGCDISAENIKYAIRNLDKECNGRSFSLFVNNGVDLQPAVDNFYDYAMSTIVLQHIAVWEIRYGILKEIYRILKEGGVFSFQMGHDDFPHPGYDLGYFENYYEATETNGKKDVCIFNPMSEIVKDLMEIGFKNIQWHIEKAFADGHHNWLYVRCNK